MAHSRLEKIGTIFSRLTGVIKSGAMKLEDRPIWYQIYQAFPPEREPRYDREVEDIPIRKIFYPEDVIKAKFLKKKSHLPAVNLTDRNNITLSQKCINLCLQIQKQKGIPLENCFDEAFESLQAEIVEGVSTISSAEAAKKGTTSSSQVELKEIFKDS